MSTTEVKDLRRVARIPVDTVLYYRAGGMHHYAMCDVTSVSAMSLELLTESPLEDGAVVNVAVRPNWSPENCTVVGTAIRPEKLDGRWLHVVKAPTARPWPPLFICRVLCSTFNPSSASVEAFLSIYGNQRLAIQNMIREALRE